MGGEQQTPESLRELKRHTATFSELRTLRQLETKMLNIKQYKEKLFIISGVSRR